MTELTVLMAALMIMVGILFAMIAPGTIELFEDAINAGSADLNAKFVKP